MTGDVFHLAIPTRDLDAAPACYRDVIGAAPAGRYADWQTFCFVGHPLVLADSLVRAYPRHFGFERCCEALVRHLSGRSWRFNDKAERHRTFWTAGPAGNVREFKRYQEPRFVY